MIAVLRDVFADDYEVVTPAHPATIVAIDAEEPDVLLVGTLGGGLTPDELVTLTTRHMRLSAVQIVLLSAEPNVLANAGRLKQHSGVTVLSLPTDLETILCVVDTVARAGHAQRPSRLPDLCSHGFDVAEARHSGCA